MVEIIEFASLETPTGAPIHLSKVEFEPSHLNPAKLTVGITSGIHGDELNGSYICALLIRILDELILQKKLATLSAKIKILPALNPSGLNHSVRFWPFDETDINRMFPGYDKGETSQRLAAAIFSELSDLTHLVDIHSSNLYVRETPQVRLYHWNEEILNLAYEFGLPILWQREMSTLEKVHLPQTLSQNGTKSFIIQAGSALEIDAKLCENIVSGILSWLMALKAMDGEKKELKNFQLPVQSSFYPVEKSKVILATSLNTLSLTSESAGFFVPSEPNPEKNYFGKNLSEGEELGTIFDPVSGQIKEKLRSPVEGTLFTIRAHPVVYQGSLLARMVSKKELPAGLQRAPQPEQHQ